MNLADFALRPLAILFVSGCTYAGAAETTPLSTTTPVVYEGTHVVGPARVTNVTLDDADGVDEMIQVDPGLPPSHLPMRLSKLETVCDRVSVHFDTESAELDSAARRKLDRLARCLRTESIRSIALIGHADERGSRPYNHRLALMRARTVARYLHDQGANPTDRIEVASRGEQAARWALYWSADRRVDIVAETAEDRD